MSLIGQINLLATRAGAECKSIRAALTTESSTARAAEAAAHALRGWCGTGADGAMVFDGTNTFTGATKASNVYTLTRDIHATTLSVSAAATIVAGGYRIYATVSVTNAGTIRNSGSSPPANSGTAGSTAGGASLVNGGAGVAGTVTAGAASAAVTNSNGAVGGTGGTGTMGAGGVAGTSTVVTAPNGGTRAFSYLPAASLGYHLAVAAIVPLRGGSGGGSGSGDGTNVGGGSGGPGGTLLVASPTIVNNGTISVAGGNGSSMTTGNVGGGGGGAGGSAIITSTTAVTGSGTITAAGGTGGTGNGTGTAGTAGGSGLILQNVVTA